MTMEIDRREAEKEKGKTDAQKGPKGKGKNKRVPALKRVKGSNLSSALVIVWKRDPKSCTKAGQVRQIEDLEVPGTVVVGIFLPQAPLRPYRSPVTRTQVKTKKNGGSLAVHSAG